MRAFACGVMLPFKMEFVILKKIISIILLVFLSSSLWAEERVLGTQISIEPPGFLEPSAQFLGYIDREYGTSIMITEIPGPIDEVMKGLSKEGLSSKGAMLLSNENITLGKDSARLLKLTQPAYGLDFTKWIVIFGDKKQSIVITASFQSELSETVSDELKRSILSSRWIREVNVDLFEGLSFSVKESKNLKVAKKVGNALILTTNGEFPLTDKTKANSIIAASISNTHEIEDYENFTKNRLLQFDGYSKIEILNIKQKEVNGLKAHIILAKAIDNKSGGLKFIHFSMLYTSDSYYIIKSATELMSRREIENEFDMLLDSFTEVSKHNKSSKKDALKRASS